jgi:hypothetical protein
MLPEQQSKKVHYGHGDPLTVLSTLRNGQDGKFYVFCLFTPIKKLEQAQE